MAYIGKQPVVGNFQVCDAITVVNGQAAYTMQVSSANVEPENANHMLVSLNGILQKPGSSFTISGATITFASNLATGDVIDFIILLGNVLDIGAPSDGTVTNAKLASDLISGETDIGGAIADADLFLLDDGAGGTLRKTAASRIKTYVGGGLSQASQWRISANQASLDSGDTITSNWEENDTNYSRIGSAMSESSGIFTFPATGIYLVEFVFMGIGGAQDQRTGIGGVIFATPDNSTYSKVTSCIPGTDSNGNNIVFTNYSSYLFDVTSTSTHKVKFAVEAEQNGLTAYGNTGINRTHATFTKLGDT